MLFIPVVDSHDEATANVRKDCVINNSTLFVGNDRQDSVSRFERCNVSDEDTLQEGNAVLSMPTDLSRDQERNDGIG
jgi:hypothetical protein